MKLNQLVVYSNLLLYSLFPVHADDNDVYLKEFRQTFDKYYSVYDYKLGSLDNRYLQHTYDLLFLYSGERSNTSHDINLLIDSLDDLLRTSGSKNIPQYSIYDPDYFIQSLDSLSVDAKDYFKSPESYHFDVPLDFLILWNSYTNSIKSSFFGIEISTDVHYLDFEIYDVRFGGERYFSLSYNDLTFYHLVDCILDNVDKNVNGFDLLVSLKAQYFPNKKKP